MGLRALLNTVPARNHSYPDHPAKSKVSILCGLQVWTAYTTN